MASASDMANLGEEGFVDSGSVKIHYVTTGAGPLAVLIHGFPGFWYDWRHQIPALARHFQVVAIDQRGFNLSDQPDGVENYTLARHVGDVDAVLEHFGQQKAIIVGQGRKVPGTFPPPGLEQGKSTGLKKRWRGVRASAKPTGLSAEAPVRRPENG